MDEIDKKLQLMEDTEALRMAKEEKAIALGAEALLTDALTFDALPDHKKEWWARKMAEVVIKGPQRGFLHKP